MKSSSHCVVEYQDEDLSICMHITGSGVHWETKKHFLSKYRVTKTYEVEGDFPLEAVRTWIDQRLMIDYDRKQIWGFVVQYLGITKSNMFGSDLEKYVCSEFCADFLAHFLGWDLGDSDTWDLNKLEMALVREKNARRIA